MVEYPPVGGEGRSIHRAVWRARSGACQIALLYHNCSMLVGHIMC